jgi:Fe-S cluster assembly ATP-binding protein
MSENILEVKNLFVSIEGKEILKGINLEIKKESVYALFGPNGSGKTTLMHSLIGMPGYNLTEGKIIFNGKDITKNKIDERSNLGLNISFQNPPIIKGVTLKNMINICLKNKPDNLLSEETIEMIKRFRLEDFLERDINYGFSGGEKKRADIIQLLLLKPKLLLLDEPDSGVDIESIKLITREIGMYIRENNASALIITHQGQMMEYITTKEACVLLDGKIHCFLEPEKILQDIKEKGYAGCLKCPKR